MKLLELFSGTQSMSNCCRGHTKSHGGYIWKYEEDVINGR